MEWTATFQAVVVLVCAGAVMVMSFVILRWAESIVKKLTRIDSLLAALEDRERK